MSQVKVRAIDVLKRGDPSVFGIKRAEMQKILEKVVKINETAALKIKNNPEQRAFWEDFLKKNEEALNIEIHNTIPCCGRLKEKGVNEPAGLL